MGPHPGRISRDFRPCCYLIKGCREANVDEADTPNLEETFREAQRGHRSDFDRLALRHRDGLVAFVASRLGPAVRSQVEAEDVVQETLLKAFEGLSRIEWKGPAAFRRWLENIALHIISNISRCRAVSMRKLTLDVAASGTSASRAMRREERFERLREALQHLSPEHRRVIQLWRLEGLPTQDIAERMGRSPGAVKQLLFRALEQLKHRFGETASLSLPARVLETDIEAAQDAQGRRPGEGAKASKGRKGEDDA